MIREPAPGGSIDALRRRDRYPRASKYDPAWVLSLDMGPHPLWQLEDLLPSLALRPGMRVLDLGAGQGATSVFLVKECDVDVVAVDLWIPSEQAAAVHEAAGVAHRVTAVHGDVRTMNFLDGGLDGGFDAIVSIDAFEYFGTDVHLLPSLLRLLRQDGRIAMSTPALRREPYEVGIPAFVEAVVGWEAAAWHTPDWWVRHWKLAGLVGDIQGQWQSGGRDDWLLWARAVREAGGNARNGPMIAMLEADTTEQLGFALVSAYKQIRK